MSRPGHVRMALTGGVASGKSTVAELLRAFGARIIDFDLLAREALEPGGASFEAAAAIFGPKSRGKDGTLDRAFIARRIFRDPKLREALEAEIHPYTWKRMTEELRRLKDAPFVVADVPLLFEARLNTLFSPTVLCFASAQVQLKRLRDRSGDLSGRQAMRIIRSQMPPAEKLRLAECVISNDGPIRETIRQTRALWDRLNVPGAVFAPRGAQAPPDQEAGSPVCPGRGTPAPE
ncbi:MAG: dephospho-CoA kinase [Deltaproteobacteria bacterium]|nr:dephospho-CoA kinase [Deltaproteobacteria bacterium]